MANIVGVTFSDVIHRGEFSCLPISPDTSESITSSGASTATSGSTSARQFIRVTTDTAIWVTVATSPTAAAGTDYFVPANGELVMYDPAGGNKVAVINA